MYSLLSVILGEDSQDRLRKNVFVSDMCKVWVQGPDTGI